METRIAVVEDEHTLFETTFEAINILYFDSNIKFKYFKNAQDFLSSSRLTEYKIILVDINLGTKSAMDGITLIDRLNEMGLLNKIIVLTGDSKIKDQLDSKKFSNIPIIRKPIDFDDCQKKLKKHIS